MWTEDLAIEDITSSIRVPILEGLSIEEATAQAEQIGWTTVLAYTEEEVQEPDFATNSDMNPFRISLIYNDAGVVTAARAG